jgi:pyruvate formate lyase activating enzyme
MLSRRQFLRAAVGVPLAGVPAALAGAGPGAELLAVAGVWARADRLAATAPPARYWARATDPTLPCRACHDPVPARAPRHAPGLVKCLLCAQGCAIAPGRRGRCRARANVGGELRSLVYGRPVAVHLDPIEKKPFYHFLPGAQAFSIGTTGCPLRCRFCQNWTLSQASPEDYDTRPVAPAEIVAAAVARGARVVAFTYNEPTVFIEYLLDIAALARARGLRSVLVSCGFMNPEPLADLCRALDAIKIDLKGFSETFYREVCGAALEPVLRTIAQIARSGTHLEIVNLVVPTLNDSERMLAELAAWVAREAGPDVPVHFTRFHPDYQLLHLAPTPVKTLERARAIALDNGLRYVYIGNVPGHPGEHTYCPGCHQVVVRRQSFFVEAVAITGGRCAFCRTPIAGVWT